MATPLVRLAFEDSPAEIYLKLECLQPAGSFKIRTAGNQVLALSSAERERGVYTASTGNLGIATAWLARQIGIPVTVLVPDDAPEAKLAMLDTLSADIRKLDYADWWRAVLNRGADGIASTYIDADGPRAMAGSATVGLELIEQLPEADTVVCSYGGGALACGVATVVKILKPGVRMIACEIETAQPLTAALAAGEAVTVPYASSFVSGMGATSVLPSMWPVARECIDGSAVVSLAQVCDAIRRLLTANHIVAEGAGAAPVAAALAGLAGRGKLVCIVSGGNLGEAELATILAGDIPK